MSAVAFERVEAMALELSEDDRKRLARALIASVPTYEIPVDDVRRRVADVQGGRASLTKIAPVPPEKAHHKARRWRLAFCREAVCELQAAVSWSEFGDKLSPTPPGQPRNVDFFLAVLSEAQLHLECDDARLGNDDPRIPGVRWMRFPYPREEYAFFYLPQGAIAVVVAIGQRRAPISG